MSYKEELQQYKQVIEVAKEKLQEQNELLTQIMSAPQQYATVVATDDRTHTAGAHKGQTPLICQKGSRVRICPGTRYRNQNSGEGVVIDRAGAVTIDGVLVHREVLVRFENNNTNWYGTGFDGSWKDVELTQSYADRWSVTISVGNNIYEVWNPKHMELKPGDLVRIFPETMQITEKVHWRQSTGPIATLVKKLDSVFSEVNIGGTVTSVYNGPLKDEDLQEGARVVLDPTGIVILRSLGREVHVAPSKNYERVSWDDICGLEEAKRVVREAVELPYKNPDIFALYGKKPTKGILMSGPPGCGKTMLAKAIATCLAQIHDNDNNDGFIYIKAPEILHGIVGQSEAYIRALFKQAREYKEKTGQPMALFIDEADAILFKRGTGISSDVDRTIVPAFLTEMDGLEDSGALVILATNRPDQLDPAVVRDGRIDRKIHVTRPTRQAARLIFMASLKQVPLAGVSVEEMSEFGVRNLFDDRYELYQIKCQAGQGDRTLCLRDIVNGAMITSIADQATSYAMHRAMDDGAEDGLNPDDMLKAVDAVYEQNLHLNHKEELQEFTRDYVNDVVNVIRVTQKRE